MYQFLNYWYIVDVILMSSDVWAQVAIFTHFNCICVRPEKFQFLEKWQNRNFDYKIVISVKNLEFIL